MIQADVDSLVPGREFTRRDFLQTGIGTGFAAATLPISAQTLVTTDHTGLVAGEVMIPVGDFQMPAYRAMPTGEANAPVILVISEIFGVHQYIADVARRFAKLGYLAIAPEMFIRQGDASGYGEIAKLFAEVINKVPDEQVMKDLDACVAWAKGQGADTSRLGITGFCWGGCVTWLYAAHNPGVKAGVAWYGRLVGTATPLAPRNPVDVAGQLAGPVLGLYGGADPGIPLDTAERIKSALAAGSAAAKKSAIHVYADAPHAFHADYRPSYRKAAADDGWNRCVDWFKIQGVV